MGAYLSAVVGYLLYLSGPVRELVARVFHRSAELPRPLRTLLEPVRTRPERLRRRFSSLRPRIGNVSDRFPASVVDVLDRVDRVGEADDRRLEVYDRIKNCVVRVKHCDGAIPDVSDRVLTCSRAIKNCSDRLKTPGDYFGTQINGSEDRSAARLEVDTDAKKDPGSRTAT